MKVALSWDGKVLRPYQDQDRKALTEKYGKGALLTTKVTHDINIRLHRKVFAVLRQIVNTGSAVEGVVFNDVDALRYFLLVRLGWCKAHMINGEEVVIPRSFSFGSLKDQKRLAAIYREMVIYLADNVSPPNQDIISEADSIIAQAMD